MTDQSCTIAQEVAQDVLKRSERGLEKYGTTLARTDLSLAEWLQHGYEEMLDGAAYLKRAQKELQTAEGIWALIDALPTDERLKCIGRFMVC